MRRLAPVLLGAALLLSASPIEPARRILDDFNDPAGWTATPSDGVALSLASDAGALRMDFDFGGHAG